MISQHTRISSIRWPLLAVVVLRAGIAGSLSGVVVDDSQAPVANARVLYKNIPALKPDLRRHPIPAGPVVASGVLTGPDGKFAVGELPSGIYNVCAYGPKDDQLGSCEWVQGTASVDLSAGQAVQNLVLHIATGTLINFDVQDPKNRIHDLADFRAADGRIPLTGGNFGIGVFAGFRYARAKLISTSQGHRQYQIAIPKSSSVRLFLETSLSMLDATGAPVATAVPGRVIEPAGSPAMTIQLTVQ